MKKQLDDKLQRKLQELKACCEKGEMDAEEIHDLLDMEIMVELAKPAEEINCAWVEACADLMADVDKECLAAQPDAPETQNQPLGCPSPKRKRRHLLPFRLLGRWALPTLGKLGIAAFACLVLVGSLLNWSWLYTEQSADGQEYYIRGRKFKVMEGGEARAADSSLEVEECVTQDFNELCEFLGFTPALPTWVPEGWELTEYYGCYTGRAYDYEVLYEKPGIRNIMRYSFMYSSNPEYEAITFFQDGVGHYRRLANGKEVYILTNVGDVGAVWHTNNTVEFLAGTISEEEVIKMVESIK